MNKTPNLFIVGAPKCGTTSIVQYLRTHPNIFLPPVKEPHYFADDFPNFQNFRTWEDYIGLYASAHDEAYLCDASVWYLYSKTALRNIYNNFPNARIILILRNPLDMLPSLHQQLFYTLDEDVADFEKAWNLQTARKAGKHIPDQCREPKFLQYSEVVDYATQLTRIFKYFPKEQVHIIFFDTLKKSPADVYKGILQFLEIEHDGRSDFPKSNTRKTFKFKFLNRIINRPPKIFGSGAKLIKKLLKVEQLNLLKLVGEMNKRKVQSEALDPMLKAKIWDVVKPSVLNLEKILDTSLESWHFSKKP